MASISGTLKVGEANATAGALMRRQRGSSLLFYAILIALLVVGAIAGMFLARALDGSPSTGGVLGLAAGWVAYAFICKPLVLARFRGAFQARQKTLDLPLRMEIAVDYLHYAVGGVTQLAQWSAVDELFRSHDYWIFQAQAHFMFAPKRFFASVDEEKRFLKEALALMSPEARARSAEAVQFADAT